MMNMTKQEMLSLARTCLCKFSAAVLLFSSIYAVSVQAFEACPGEGTERFPDGKCAHDAKLRYCAIVLDQENNMEPLLWGNATFWEITGQEDTNWSLEAMKNGGDSQCMDIFAISELMLTLGCENVHLRCEATDVVYIRRQYIAYGAGVEHALACIESKCPTALVELGADGEVAEGDAAEGGGDKSEIEAGRRKTDDRQTVLQRT